MELKLQGMPCFCSKRVFWCFLRYERWFSRVLGQFGSMEDVHKVCSGLCLQEVEVGVLLQCFFKVKQRSVSCDTSQYNALMYAAS